MNTLDIIILVCLLPAIWAGISKGLVKQLVALAALVIGVALAAKFAPEVGAWINRYLSVNGQLLNIIGFVVIAAVAIVVLNLLGSLVSKVIKIATLGWLDKLLGVIFSLLEAVIIIGLVITVFDGLNGVFGFVKQDTLDSSVLYGAIKDACNHIFPSLKALIAKNA